MMMKWLCVIGVCLGFVLPVSADQKSLPAKLPFSDGVIAGDILFMSGQLGITPEGKLIEGGIGPETRQTMDNIKKVAEKYGASMDKMVKCTVFLADIAEWAEMNKVYITYFPGRPPARSALGASGLALNARVEIECIAHLD